MHEKTFELFTPEGKGILGEIDERGLVTFAIQAGEGSSIRGTEMFNRMIDFFGDAVTGIAGHWVKGKLECPSANIDKVNELVSAGWCVEDAILQTWTVTRARKKGFGSVMIVTTAKALSGYYCKIEVLMTK